MARLIRVDGTEQGLANAEYKTLKKAIGGWIERVRLPEGRDMIVDEQG